MPRTVARRKNRDRQNLGVPIYYAEAPIEDVLRIFLVRMDLVDGRSVDMASVEEIYDEANDRMLYRGNPWIDADSFIDSSTTITQPVDEVVRIVIY